MDAVYKTKNHLELNISYYIKKVGYKIQISHKVPFNFPKSL